MRVIVVGAGEVGYHIAKRLVNEGHDVTIIEENAAVKERVEKELDVLAIQGNGASPAALEAAGVTKAKILIAVTDEDEMNLVASLLAKKYEGERTTIARVRNPEFWKSPLLQSGGRLGIDHLINPNQVVAEEIARLVHAPAAAEVAFFAEGKVQLLGIHVGPEAPILKKLLKDLRAFQAKHPFLVTAISRKEQLIIPDGKTVIEPKDHLYLVAHRDDMPAIMDLFGLQEVPPRNVLIIGGGRIGLSLAELLEAEGIPLTLMERNANRCDELANRLKKALVLKGDGTDIEALAEEGVAELDAVVTVSDDEATNILAALLAKNRFKAKKAIALIQRAHLIQLASSLGIDAAISPRLTTASVILRHVRRGRVVSLVEMPEEAEIMEIVALPTTAVVDRPLRDLNMPKGSIVAAISRGEQIIIPKGESRILPGDRVVLFALPEAISKVERLFSG